MNCTVPRDYFITIMLINPPRQPTEATHRVKGKTMEAKELRLGNLVMSSGNNCTVVAIHEDEGVSVLGSDFYLTENESDLQPIPLTEEWLLKFGFKTMIVEDYDIFLLGGFLIEVYTDTCVVCFDNVEITKIKYVHSLQNLFFALTGTELTTE